MDTAIYRLEQNIVKWSGMDLYPDSYCETIIESMDRQEILEAYDFAKDNLKNLDETCFDAGHDYKIISVFEYIYDEFGETVYIEELEHFVTEK